MSDKAFRDLRSGTEYPYHHRAPTDWCEKAALGILRDLSDRRGIKYELDAVDDNTREDIVHALSDIIRTAFEEDTKER